MNVLICACLCNVQEVAQSLALEKVNQRLLGGVSTEKGNPVEMGRMKRNEGDINKLKEDYRALLSAYEAAKIEADHAKAALKEIRKLQISNSASKLSANHFSLFFTQIATYFFWFRSQFTPQSIWQRNQKKFSANTIMTA